MKKALLGIMVVAVAAAFALSVSAKTVEETKVKAGDFEAKEKVTTTKEGTKTQETVKGKAGKIERERVDTAEGSAGKTRVTLKNGALKELNIDWVYFKDLNNNYIIEYTVKDKSDPELLQELNLTPTQANMIKPGKHTITSTSPYTALDAQANVQNIIVKDLRASLQ